MKFVCDTLDVSPREIYRAVHYVVLRWRQATISLHPNFILRSFFTSILLFNMRSYQYAPLDRKSDTIRLLRLLPSEVDKAEIRAGLLEYDLRHSQQSRHSYEALSYVWGGMETTESVLIGDEELGITPNLHAALLRLRDATFPRMLWVDAVCINQSDIPEKEIQIQSMAKIYGYAKCTIVWLGEEADGSDTALEALRLAGSLPVPDFSDGGARNYDKGIDKPVASLLQRDWFQRIWVKQQLSITP